MSCTLIDGIQDFLIVFGAGILTGCFLVAVMYWCSKL